MRFNDLLRTVLANMGDGTVATVTRWRQCMDLLAQYDVSGAHVTTLSAEDRDAILARLEMMRPQLSVEQRVASVVELGGRLRSPGLVRLLGQDHPTLVAAMMAKVALSDADWIAIIPDLGPLARSVLRRRIDLGPGAIAALQRFGTTDLSLTTLVPKEVLASPSATPHPVQQAANDGDPAEAQSQIGRIVAQIERFTETRQHRREDAPAMEAVQPSSSNPTEEPPRPNRGALVRRFTFETDAAGIIRTVAGAPRAAAAGLSIGTPAGDGRYGADGRALGAFRHRAAFEDARFTIGEGLLAGEWRLSGTPRFDPGTGRFLDYSGEARRELPHEALIKASGDAPGWAGLSAASTRQLIHELRTPLNAIQGYAEMIEAQLVGPVASDYRDMAGQILVDARALLATFDDLDLASRIERGDHHAATEVVDLRAMVENIIATFGQDSPVRITVAASADLPPIASDRAQVERMLAHLIRAGCAALGEGERLAVTLMPGATPDTVEVAVRRPVVLIGLADAVLLKHDSSVDGKLSEAPQLGLAFTLRLVRGIADHLDGHFEMTPHDFRLVLPSRATVPEEQGRSL